MSVFAARCALLLPGGLLAYTAFSAGGYFAGTTAVAAVVVAVVLALRVTLAERPFAGLSAPLAAAAGALGLLAAWTLVSASWSHAPARALIEFDRALLYLLVLVLCGSYARTTQNVRWIVRGLAAAAVLVCVAALASRLLPDVIHTSPTVVNERLGWPLTYWNALGLVAVFGAMLCLGLASDRREPASSRILAAGGLPVASAVLMLTFSRGGFVAGAVGLTAFVVLARPRAVLPALTSVLPAMAVSAGQAYRSDLVQRADPTGPASLAQGHELALVVAACVLAAAGMRAVTLRLERRMAPAEARPRVRRALRLGTAVLVAAAVVVAIGPLDVTARAERQYHRFVDGAVVDHRGDVRSRLADPGNNGRLGGWRASLDAFADEPLHGSGAGTWQHLWAERRSTSFTMIDGHSLYLETLAELGWVGLALVGMTLAAILAALAARVRGPDRTLHAGLLAACLAWTLHAGLDWDWEMPAATLGVFAIAGIALAGSNPSSFGRGRTLRLIAAVALLILAVTPARVAISQAHLRASAGAFEQGDCGTAIDRALASSAAVGVRPEPFELLAYCDARLGRYELAERMMRAAIRRDPRSWELEYGLAVVRAAGGRDPRPAVRRALRLNPLGRLPREAARLFATHDPDTWKRRALRARLPVQ
jgi:hypothetical protein